MELIKKIELLYYSIIFYYIPTKKVKLILKWITYCMYQTFHIHQEILKIIKKNISGFYIYIHSSELKFVWLL